MAKRTQIHTARFELRCSPEELKRWRSLAAEQEISLAKYIRACLNQGPRLARKVQTDPALIRQLASIGNNLNQIAWWANTYKAKQAIAPVEEGIEAVRRALAALSARGTGDDDHGF